MMVLYTLVDRAAANNSCQFIVVLWLMCTVCILHSPKESILLVSSLPSFSHSYVTRIVLPKFIRWLLGDFNLLLWEQSWLKIIVDLSQKISGEKLEMTKLFLKIWARLMRMSFRVPDWWPIMTLNFLSSASVLISANQNEMLLRLRYRLVI